MSTSLRQRTILLFQPYLRVHILNFGEPLKRFRFVLEKPPTFASSKAFYGKVASSAEAEFSRNKVTVFTRLRRLLGILNVRVKYTRDADLLFTYGCFLVTNRPYCIYIENGATLFNYDPAIVRNPFARLWFAVLVRLPQCRKLIFMSRAAQKSLLATAKFSRQTQRIIEQKSVQIYPFVRDPVNVKPKRLGKTLRLLFTGIFYVKGGIETLNAFDTLRRQGVNVTLTIITPLQYLLPGDRERIERTSGVILKDAALSKEEMARQYRRHDVFLFPTFRDTFGLVLIEALAAGLPVIAVDQYAVTELVTDGLNGFVYPDHPLTDYNRETYEMYGRLYNARDFYEALFAAQRKQMMKPIEQFIVQSVRTYIARPRILTEHSRNAIASYQERFAERVIGKKIEQAFTDALGRSAI